MNALGWGIYTLPIEEVTAEVLSAFLTEQRTEKLLSESMTVELKRERRGTNVAKAVAALANSAGGVVIVGVDEIEPDLDGAPGLEESALVGLVSHLNEVLTPPLTPEFATVKVPEKDRMVVVIRVEPDSQTWPVVCGGQVVVRNPGQSAPAAHHQIVDLVRRRNSAVARAGELAFAVRSTHTPSIAPGTEDTRGDLLVRLATAVYARPQTVPVTFGSAVRAQIQQAFADSPFAALFGPAHLRGSTRPRAAAPVEVDDFASTYFSASATKPDIGTADLGGHLALRVQRNAGQLSFYIEAEARRPLDLVAGRGDRVAKVGRSEMCLVVLAGLESIREHLLPVIVDLIGGSPAAVDDVSFWVQSPSTGDLGAVLDTTRVFRASSPSAASSWSADVSQSSLTGGIATGLQSLLETFYLDLGFEDESEVAAGDLRSGARELDWLVGR